MAPAPSNTWIVGLAEARTAPARDDVSITEFAWEAVRPALEDAGTTLQELGGAVTASQDFWDGRTISSMNVNELVGGTYGSEAKVAADGAQALAYACARIDDEDQQLNVVLAHAKESQGDKHVIELAAFDPYYERPLDPDETVVAAFQAQRLYANSSFEPAHAARLVAAARRRSTVLGQLTPDDVLTSPPTADPLRELDRAPLMDAACALVVCDSQTRQKLGRPAVRVVATASRTGAYWSQRLELERAPEAQAAAADALAIAGWTIEDLDYVEINAPYAHQHLIVARELGLGEGEDLVQRFEANGKSTGPQLNASGGWLSGSAGTVAGLRSVAWIANRLRETGGRALVMATTGLANQSHHAVLLEGAR